MPTSHTAASIISHLGGESVLARIGAHDFFWDDSHLSFKLRSNPKDVHSVVISIEPNGFFRMDCYGQIAPGTLKASLVGTAHEIISESLATVLGQLTGIESIHHRHF